MRVLGMRPGISITLKRRDRSRLEAIVGDRNAPQKQVWRAAIVLLSADGLGSVEIMYATISSPGDSKRATFSPDTASIPCGEERPRPAERALQQFQPRRDGQPGMGRGGMRTGGGEGTPPQQ